MITAWLMPQILIEGYPVLTVGTTDMNRAFHPLGFGIVNHEI